MSLGKRLGGSLFPLVIVGFFVISASDAATDDRPSLQATSTTPVEDDRIAALRQVIPPASAGCHTLG